MHHKTQFIALDKHVRSETLNIRFTVMVFRALRIASLDSCIIAVAGLLYLILCIIILWVDGFVARQTMDSLL